MVEFYYNCSINEALTHSPFEVMYEYKQSTTAYRPSPLTSATTDATNRLTSIANIQDVVNQILELCKDRMAARFTKDAPSFQPGDLVYLLTKTLHIRSQK